MPRDRDLCFVAACRSLEEAIVNAEQNGYVWAALTDGRRNKEAEESTHSIMVILHITISKELCSMGSPEAIPTIIGNTLVRGTAASHNYSVMILLCWLYLIIGEAIIVMSLLISKEMMELWWGFTYKPGNWNCCTNQNCWRISQGGQIKGSCRDGFGVCHSQRSWKKVRMEKAEEPQ